MMLPPAPATLVGTDGLLTFGAYGGAIGDSSLGRLGTASRLHKALGQKRWLYLGVYSPEVIACACVVDLTYMGSGFAFVFDRTTRRLVDHHFIGPRLSQMVPDSPTQGTARFSWPGARIELISQIPLGRRWIRAELGRGEKRTFFEVDIDDNGQRLLPLSAIIPHHDSCFNYTHKAAGLPARGVIRAGSQSYSLQQAFAAVDYTHGLPQRNTNWLWISGAGRTTEGHVLGINLVHSKDEREATENGAWIDGCLCKIGPTEIARSPSLWTAQSENLSLRFYPEAERRQDVDIHLIASHYVQPIGRFEGELYHQGKTFTLEGVSGVTEDHRALW